MIVAILSLLCAGAAAQRDAISLDVRDARLIDVVFLLATQAGKNVIATQDAGKQHVTLHVRAEPFDQILQSLARMYGLQVANKGNVYLLRGDQNASHLPRLVHSTL